MSETESGPTETLRLETFSDAVLAVIITIMVLELKHPDGARFSDLSKVAPTFLAYLLSFWFLGIYWNNHHHLLRIARKVKPSVMWANMHLLFWLSLIPFFTSWMGKYYKSTAPTALYAVGMLGSALAYSILQHVIVADFDRDSEIVKKLEDSSKGIISLALYVAAFVLAFVNHWFSDALFVAVAAMWVIPDRRLVE